MDSNICKKLILVVRSTKDVYYNDIKKRDVRRNDIKRNKYGNRKYVMYDMYFRQIKININVQ